MSVFCLCALSSPSRLRTPGRGERGFGLPALLLLLLVSSSLSLFAPSSLQECLKTFHYLNPLSNCSDLRIFFSAVVCAHVFSNGSKPSNGFAIALTWMKLMTLVYFSHTDAELLEQLCLRFSTLEPSLPDHELVRLDLIADQLEIKRLRNMGVLIPANEFAFKGEKLKMLTTRMVRTWRDKTLNGQRIWLRRSKYVAREFAWLSPDRQDFFSPVSSVLIVRLPPCLYMKWKCMGYVLCSIDIGHAFLTVEQKDLTETVCVDAAGVSTTYVLGRVLPGQRNGSQMWHESFSRFLQTELRIHECEPYPCLLKSPNAECALLLHVDDVLCLAQHDYFVLEPALRKGYKISLEVFEKPGDELTFLKRRRMLLSERELAIQNHPKHLEKFFGMMKISRGLKPKQVPVHQLLDEPDETDELAPDKAKIFRLCIGILLYIASDLVECQYAIRGLAQVMSKPTVQAFLCLRHLCLYLLGCVDHCTVMTYSDHQGLLHYTPTEYAMEVYSDSNWAKQKKYPQERFFSRQPHVLQLEDPENDSTFFSRSKKNMQAFQDVLMEN